MAGVQPIPDGMEGVIPYLVCEGAADAIDFYRRAFGAEELYRFEAGGMIGHAEIMVGGSRIMLADDQGIPDEWGFGSPGRAGMSTVTLHRYVEDVDAAAARAEAEGAKVVRPPEDQFYGDRSCQLIDPWGHVWSLATHVRDVSQEEMAKAQAEWDEKLAGGDPG